MLRNLNPTEGVLDRLTDREFAREWLKAQDEEVEAKDKRIAELGAVLTDAYGHLAGGSATEIARHLMLQRIKTVLGWSDVEAEAARKIEELQDWMNT